MDFSGSDRQRSRPVEHANRRRQVIMGAQEFVELAAVGLLDHQDAFDTGKGGGESFRLDRQ